MTKKYIKMQISVDPSKIGPTITVKEDKQLNPDHYKAGKLQTIEQMMIVFGPNKVASFCEVNAFKYHARAGLKGDAVMDHKKADWYLELARDLDGAESIADGMDRLLDFLERVQGKNDQ